MTDGIPTAPVALYSVELTRDTMGMCVVKINGREAIRDNGDVISHFATLDWFAAPEPLTDERAAFENWALENDPRCDLEPYTLKGNHAGYIDEGLDHAWSAWQARAAMKERP